MNFERAKHVHILRVFQDSIIFALSIVEKLIRLTGTDYNNKRFSIYFFAVHKRILFRNYKCQTQVFIFLTVKLLSFNRRQF